LPEILLSPFPVPLPIFVSIRPVAEEIYPRMSSHYLLIFNVTRGVVKEILQRPTVLVLGDT